MSVLVPQLELLFLDKYIERESTPRTEGYDADLLARQYVLDRAKIHEYLDQLVITPAILDTQRRIQRHYQMQIDGIRRNIGWIRKEFEDVGADPALSSIVNELNARQQADLAIWGHESSRVSSGIRLNLWESLRPEQFDADGNIIDQAFLRRLHGKLQQKARDAIEVYKSEHLEVDRLFDEIEKEFTLKQ